MVVLAALADELVDELVELVVVRDEVVLKAVLDVELATVLLVEETDTLLVEETVELLADETVVLLVVVGLLDERLPVVRELIVLLLAGIDELLLTIAEEVELAVEVACVVAPEEPLDVTLEVVLPEDMLLALLKVDVDALLAAVSPMVELLRELLVLMLSEELDEVVELLAPEDKEMTWLDNAELVLPGSSEVLVLLMPSLLNKALLLVADMNVLLLVVGGVVKELESEVEAEKLLVASDDSPPVVMIGEGSLDSEADVALVAVDSPMLKLGIGTLLAMLTLLLLVSVTGSVLVLI